MKRKITFRLIDEQIKFLQVDSIKLSILTCRSFYYKAKAIRGERYITLANIISILILLLVFYYLLLFEFLLLTCCPLRVLIKWIFFLLISLFILTFLFHHNLSCVLAYLLSLKALNIVLNPLCFQGISCLYHLLLRL